MSDSTGPKGIGDIRALSALNLGCSIVAPLIVFIVGGLFLDQYLDTMPLLTLIGVGLGLTAAGAQLYRLARYDGQRRGKGSPVRKMTTHSPSRSPSRPGGKHNRRDDGVQ